MNAWLEPPVGGQHSLSGQCAIGRLPDNDLVMDDLQVSRRHALIFPDEQGRHWLADLGSSNGVFLNRRRVQEPVQLKDRDQIHIGQHLVVFRENAPPRPRAPARLPGDGAFQKTERAACPFAEVDHGAVLLSTEGAVQFMSDNARRWLADYFPGASPAGELPPPLRRWLRKLDGAGAGVEPFIAAGGDRRLAVRLAEGRTRRKLLLFTEERPAFATESLVRLGLTLRESEVLHWISEGKTNAEIATILDMSPRTVEKHLNSIFSHLEVQNRAAAMMRVMERFGRPGA